MTRPHMVRADTLDLQDPESPHASQPAKQHPQLNGGIAPHQASEVNHVLEERHSEEESLREAWGPSDQLTDEPDSLEHADEDGDGAMEGTQEEHTEGTDDAEGESDDDMMDRISSSPSIDDGGSTSSSSPQISNTVPVLLSCTPPLVVRRAWPDRWSSLTPSSRLKHTAFNQPRAFSSPIPGAEEAESASFFTPPEQSPLPVTAALLDAESLHTSSSSASRDEEMAEAFFSSFIHKPAHIPLDLNKPLPIPSEHHHHHMGKNHLDHPKAQHWNVDTNKLETLAMQGLYSPGLPAPSRDSKHEGWLLDDFDKNHDEHATGVTIRSPMLRPFRTLRSSIGAIDLNDLRGANHPGLPRLPSFHLDNILLPVDDPLLEAGLGSPRSSASWESVEKSDDSSSGDVSDSTDRHNTDDDADDVFLDFKDRDQADRFIDSEWDGECLRDAEDIDFEFVYALHTFVATVEGQANATKGDTMVLLDDSNSYWWLVRVVKDSSIGYLPAEHIETPTERLARLNKHRNIDLSATMLGDNPEKSKNPLKKAIRRRNAKTVQFAAPTYVEASDIEYSTDDETENAVLDPYTTMNGQDEDEQDQQQQEQQSDQQQHQQQQQGEVAPTVEEPSTQQPTAHVRKSSDVETQPKPSMDSMSSRGSFEVAAAGGLAYGTHSAPLIEDPQLSPKLVDKTEAAPLKSRKGTPRNTDSFLKDDSIETRKITLTPGLLREEGDSQKGSSESPRNNSLESLQKQQSPPEQPEQKVKRSEKPKKEKKQGMLSGLFKSKKKDKKTKDEDASSLDTGRSSPRESPRASGASSPAENNRPTTADSAKSGLSSKGSQQKVGKLQQVVLQQPGSTTPQGSTDSQLNPRQAKEQSAQFFAELEGSEVAYEMPAEEQQFTGPKAGQKAKRTKQRMELDDFDAPVDASERERERLSESPIDLSSTFMHGTEIIHIPEPGFEESSSSEEEKTKERDSTTSSPDLVELPGTYDDDDDGEGVANKDRAQTGEDKDEDDDPTPTLQSPNVNTDDFVKESIETQTPKSTTTNKKEREMSTDSTATSSTAATPASASSQSSWSDASLRAWLDGSDNDVRDMLVLIHDKSGVLPVSDQHPVMAGLFARERKGVQDMMGELDGLLGGFMQKRGIVVS